jgi:glycosyltransferase involved in cell wall biosynthesis
MISILIPVFNYDINELAGELSEQLGSLPAGGEILIYDDGSGDSFRTANRKTEALTNVSYTELDRNIGRIAIRNLLASKARFEWILFIDSDSKIITGDYLKKYIEAIEAGADVCVGGTSYQAEMPLACEKRLHWKYGTEREAVQRSRTALHVNNFCIRKELFLELNFPQLQGYGHEDTWLHLELERLKKRIVFIHNPVQHEGLENVTVFLEKSKNALKNLLLLAGFTNLQQLQKRSSLFRLFYWQKKLGLSRMTRFVLKSRMKKIEANLHSCDPSLLQFDLYRLYHIHSLARQTPLGYFRS